jgi:hypothetical protein
MSSQEIKREKNQKEVNMELKGIEPMTYGLQSRRSPS